LWNDCCFFPLKMFLRSLKILIRMRQS
jgi:hypothetical protein